MTGVWYIEMILELHASLMLSLQIRHSTTPGTLHSRNIDGTHNHWWLPESLMVRQIWEISLWFWSNTSTPHTASAAQPMGGRLKFGRGGVFWVKTFLNLAPNLGAMYPTHKFIQRTGAETLSREKMREYVTLLKRRLSKKVLRFETRLWWLWMGGGDNQSSVSHRNTLYSLPTHPYHSHLQKFNLFLHKYLIPNWIVFMKVFHCLNKRVTKQIHVSSF